jgi:tetratricopeptide (TPR) repeat protein
LNILHIKDVGNSQIQFMWQRGNSLPIQHSHLISISNPLSPEDKEELRWYLEDYLIYPYGFEFRAQKVENKMIQWGESLFQMVFIKSQEDPDPRGMYQEAVREGLENCELCISSNDPSFLNIPWELIRDPTPGRGYLAPLLAGLYRQRIGLKIETSNSSCSCDHLFRILLVISRPGGEDDIPYGTVSRPLIEALRPLSSRIKLEVLRPPTFEALVEKLNEKPGYYNLVHFDGHGSFEHGNYNNNSMRYGSIENCGCLVFEKEEEGCHFVNSKDLGQALARAKVPLFVLNACQSAVEGENEAFSSVASQLISVGAKGVVAMGYSVYASSATHFIQKVYENLIRGKSLSEAVAAGRRGLYSTFLKDSVVGQIEFRDWMVPTLYQQEQNYTPISVSSYIVPPDLQEEDLMQQAEKACPEGRFGFIGRDNDILRIERELRDNNRPWVLLSGIGGVGKTELAYGFARWYVETGGCDGGVFETSFKVKADFGQIVGSIVGHATDFSKYSPEKQFQILVRHLRENPCLLIWDNFESVSGYPQGSEPVATVDELKIISSFLKSLRGGKSRVIITTRKENEDWIGIAPNFIRIFGLNDRDRGELAKVILKTIGRKPEDFRQDRNYGELLKLLNGHPRSLEVVLPQLRKKSPSEIIRALQYEVNELGEQIEDVSLSFAFSQLSPMTKKHLPFLGLYASIVSPRFLENFVGNEGVIKATYEKVMGEGLSLGGWKSVIEEAAINGLIESIGGELYELHPTLPSFLRRQLVKDVGDYGLKTLNTEFVIYYAGFISYIYEDIRKSELGTKMILTVEEPNILRALRSAEISEDWASVYDISKGILEYYESMGRIVESNTLRMHLLDLIGLELTSEDSREKGTLSIYLLQREAYYLMSINKLEEAATLSTRTLNYLISFKDPKVEDGIAALYHQLGIITEELQQFDEAEKWYRKSLEIHERLGLDEKKAMNCHQLGIIAYKLQRLDEAEEWYRKSLIVFEYLELERDAASDYHNLGMIAEERRQFDEAEKWYRKSLGIRERLGLKRDAATDYSQLGSIAQKRQRFNEAGRWYRKSLEIYERLGLERDASTIYSKLGNIVQELQRFDEAEKWFRKSLEIYERLGLERQVADKYDQLAIIAEKCQRFDEAEKCYRKALEIKERLGFELYVVYEYTHLGMIAEKCQRFDEAEKCYRKAQEIKERLSILLCK